MADSERKADPTGMGLILACLGAVFVGLWMVGQSVATEGEAIKNQLKELQTEVAVLNIELRGLKAKAADGQLAAAEPAQAGDHEPVGETKGE